VSSYVRLASIMMRTSISICRALATGDRISKGRSLKPSCRAIVDRIEGGHSRASRGLANVHAELRQGAHHDLFDQWRLDIPTRMGE
jgi:hypothetical protein